MAKVYWIATYRSVKDQEALDAYAKLAGPAIWSAGGCKLVRGVPAKTLEEGLNMRTVGSSSRASQPLWLHTRVPPIRPRGRFWETAPSGIFALWKAWIG